MSKFSECAANLDKALIEVEAKKVLAISAQVAASKAQTDYDNAAAKVNTLKQELNAILNETVPTENVGRVRTA